MKQPDSIFNLTEPQKQFVRDIKFGRSWRRVAEITGRVYPELNIQGDNQIDGIELCNEAKCNNNIEIAIVQTPVDEYNQDIIGTPNKSGYTPTQIAEKVYYSMLFSAKTFCEEADDIEDLNAIIQIASTRIDELKGNTNG